MYSKPYCCIIVSPFAIRCYNIWVMLDEILFFSDLFCLFVKILFHTKIFERFKLSLTYLICHCQVDPKVIKVPNWQWQRMIERIFQIEVDNRVSPALVRKSPISLWYCVEDGSWMFERIILILLEGFECLSYGMTAPNDMSATTVPSASGKPS